MRRLIVTLLIFGTLNARDTMGNKIHHVNAGDALFLEHIHRLALLLTEDGHQHIGTGYLLLARGLYVKYSTL